MQWVNVINELANMTQLEPLLFKRMLRNVAQELKTMEGFSVESQYQGMDLEILVKKAKLCKVWFSLRAVRRINNSHSHQATPCISHLQIVAVFIVIAQSLTFYYQNISPVDY